MAGLLERIKNQNEVLQKGKVDPDALHNRIYAEITKLNNLGISLMDYPEATRHRAFLLEQEITRTANAGDMAAFDDLLSQWRQCFH